MADISQKVQTILTAENKTGPAVDDAARGFDKLSTGAKVAAGAIAGAFVGAVAAAVKIGKESFHAFVESEKQMQQATFTLTNTLESMTEQQWQAVNGNYTLADTLTDLKAEMEMVGKQAVQLGMDDEEASKAFAKLFSITKDVGKAQDEVRLAMDLAAYSGRSLEESARALTLVHAGGTKVLKEFGLEVDANITAADALALVHEKVSGAATEMANTTSGQMAVLSQSWSNLKEDVGATIAEAIGPFIQMLTDWVNNDQTRKLIMDLAKNIKEFANQLAPLIKEALPVLLQLLTWTVGIIGGFIKGIGEMIEGVKQIIGWIKDFVNWLGTLIDKLSQAIAKAKEFAGSNATKAATSAFGTTAKTMIGATNPVLGAVLNVMNGIKGFATGGVVGGPLGMPQLAVVHGGETVVPAGGGYGGITLNIGGNMFLDDSAAEYFGNRLVDILKKEIRIGE